MQTPGCRSPFIKMLCEQYTRLATRGYKEGGDRLQRLSTTNIMWSAAFSLLPLSMHHRLLLLLAALPFSTIQLGLYTRTFSAIC